jgi:mannosyl-3-phosphoglycerate phosphatase
VISVTPPDNHGRPNCPATDSGEPRLRFPALVFTDLDGTLLDHNSYSAAAALDALRELEAQGVPVILNTSKTFAETLEYQALLRVPAPFVAENGGVICVPEDFPVAIEGDRQERGYRLLIQPPGIEAIVAGVQRIRGALGLRMSTFHEHDAAWVARQTGLDRHHAELARLRLGSLPLLWDDTAEKLTSFQEALASEELGLLRGGRFHHVVGRWDKASSMQQVVALYASLGWSGIQCIALGDSPNDETMLAAADIAVAVRDHRGRHLSLAGHPHPVFTLSSGPAGWSEAVTMLLRPDGTS